MISVGSAIAFCILSGVAGIVVGALIGEHERRSEHRTEEVGSEWGRIDAAATEAYYGAWSDSAREPSGLPLLVTFGDIGPLGGQYVLNREGFEAWAGVPAEEILRRLIPA